MKFIKITLALTALCAITTHAHANDNTPKAKMGQPYLGVKAGIVDILDAGYDVPARAPIEPIPDVIHDAPARAPIEPINDVIYDAPARASNGFRTVTYGVYGGYQLNNGYGIELYYNTADGHKDVSGFDFYTKVQMYGGYVTYNHNFTDKLYGKVKIGMGHTNIDVKSISYQKSRKESHNDSAVGLNIGYNLNKKFALDAELYGSHARALTLGAKVKF